ncbi:MAG TPA: hypothetical protein VF867_05760 [Arthrobacter sp.]
MTITGPARGTPTQSAAGETIGDPASGPHPGPVTGPGPGPGPASGPALGPALAIDRGRQAAPPFSWLGSDAWPNFPLSADNRT